jgi:hypothetical protein
VVVGRSQYVYKLDMLNSYFVTLAYSSSPLAAVWIWLRTSNAPDFSEEAAVSRLSQWKTLWRGIFPVALPGVFPARS